MVVLENLITMLIIICMGIFAIIGTLTVLSNVYSLKNIKNKRVGHGQHGNACFAAEKEIKKFHTKRKHGEKTRTRAICRRVQSWV